MRTQLRELPVLDVREDGTFEITEISQAGALALKGRQALELMEDEEIDERGPIVIKRGKLAEGTFG